MRKEGSVIHSMSHREFVILLGLAPRSPTSQASLSTMSFTSLPFQIWWAVYGCSIWFCGIFFDSNNVDKQWAHILKIKIVHITLYISSFSWKERRGGKGGDLEGVTEHFCAATIWRTMSMTSAIYRSCSHFASASEVFALPFLVSLWILWCSFILSIKYFQFSSQGQYSTVLPYTLEVMCGHECTLAKEMWA